MFVFHDEPLPEDTLLVLNAAAKLDTTEFRLFELAYQDWYGKLCNTSVMETYFTPYMFDNVVPFWVRAFCRKIITFHGELETVQTTFGLRTTKVTRGNKMFGILYGAILVFCLVFLVYIFSLPADSLPGFLKECYFPPCY